MGKRIQFENIVIHDVNGNDKFDPQQDEVFIPSFDIYNPDIPDFTKISPDHPAILNFFSKLGINSLTDVTRLSAAARFLAVKNQAASYVQYGHPEAIEPLLQSARMYTEYAGFLNQNEGILKDIQGLAYYYKALYPSFFPDGELPRPTLPPLEDPVTTSGVAPELHRYLDPAFDERRYSIQDVDPSIPSAIAKEALQSLYPGIELPVLDVTTGGITWMQDLKGEFVNEIKSDPVSFLEIGNRLFVLATDQENFLSVLLVYDITTTPPSPVLNNDYNLIRDSKGGPSNAILLGIYNATAMTVIEETRGGKTKRLLNILWSDDNVNQIIATFDPETGGRIDYDWVTSRNDPF